MKTKSTKSVAGQKGMGECDPLDLYSCYHWLIENINPYNKGLDLDKIPQPFLPVCANEWRNDFGSLIKIPELDLIFSILFFHGDFPLLRTKDGRTISCVNDIKRLWQDVGLQKPNTNDTFMPSPDEHACSIEAYLAPENKKNVRAIVQRLLRKEAPEPQGVAVEVRHVPGSPPQPVQGKGIKKFFRNPWKLAGVIIAFISMIFGILQFLVMTK